MCSSHVFSMFHDSYALGGLCYHEKGTVRSEQLIAIIYEYDDVESYEKVFRLADQARVGGIYITCKSKYWLPTTASLVI